MKIVLLIGGIVFAAAFLHVWFAAVDWMADQIGDDSEAEGDDE